MPSNPITGAGYLLSGVRLILRPGLRRFVAIPLAVNVLVFAAGLAALVHWFDGLVQVLQARVPTWLQWLDWVLWPLFALLALAVVFYGFALVANLIAAPFNSLLAQRAEQSLMGRDAVPEQGWADLLKDLLPTLIDEVRKLVYALVLAIPFLLLLFVPVIGPLLWFAYTAWIMAVQYGDYPMGNHGLRLADQRKRLKTRRLESLGFGAAVAGAQMIPVVNFIVMPAAVAGATALWVRGLDRPGRQAGHFQSRVATRYLLLTIDQLSGAMSGEVLEGPQRGRPLAAVSTEDLLDLWQRASRDDVASAESIEVYLERERDHRVRPNPPPGPGASSHAERGERPPGRSGISPMAESEARAVLGVDAEASPEEVRAAHKRLMQRLHPDRGGTDYLAAKVNEAKDTLTG
jgi:CysZ protein